MLCGLFCYPVIRIFSGNSQAFFEILDRFSVKFACLRTRADYVLRWKFIESAPEEALAAIEKEVLRRRRKQKRPQTELRLVVSGLWNSSPDDCWQLELSLIEKQQIDFRLLSPDEPLARATFEETHPDLVQSRKALLSRLKPADLYAEEDEEGLAVAESEDVESEESED